MSSGDQWLADRFEEHRGRLRAVAYRLLGSFAEADDAVQDAWLRLSRADTSDVENLGAWLTTVVARISLNMLRSRRVHREEALDVRLPDPMITPDEHAVVSDSVGLALLVVLDTLSPAERLAFVLHDLFDMPFEEIAPIVDRSLVATRQLASRARRRVRGASPRSSDSDAGKQRELVNAFFRAARAGDFEGLLAVLDPEVVLRSDFGARRPAAAAPPVVIGATAVARTALLAAVPAELQPVRINGTAGVVVIINNRPFAIMAFTVTGGRISEIHALADPARVPGLSRIGT
jgi:RNA polymerase sigma factor (sigma-70 family)